MKIGEKKNTLLSKCHFCNGKIEHKTKPMEYEYKGKKITVDQPGQYCNNCDEAFFSKEDSLATEKELVNFRREVDHLLSTDEIKRIRKKLKLTQQKAGEFFGGGIRAFSKYERGESNQSKPVNALLRMLDDNVLSIDILKKYM